MSWVQVASTLLLLFSIVAGAGPGFGPPQSYNPSGNPPWPPVQPAPDWTLAKFDEAFMFPVGKPEKGGCTAEQKSKLRDAFNEVMYLARLLYEYFSAELQGVTPYPHVGDFLYEIFGIHPSYYISRPNGGGSYDGEQDPVKDRSLYEIEKLQRVRGLMVLIAKHGRNELPWVQHQSLRTTRLYCDSSWWTWEEYQRDNEGRKTAVKLVQGPMYYDAFSNSFSWIPTGKKFDPKKGKCGPEGSDDRETEAFTNRDENAITFCPEVWKPGHPVRMPIADANPAKNPPQPIDWFDSLSWSFLHEYTHLVGDTIFEDDGVKDHLGDDGEASYGFARCSKLSASERPLTNADSYALLAVACYITQYDWSDGFCRLPQ